MLEMTAREIEVMLADSAIGRLAMAGRDGRPYCIPLPFCWLDGALYLRLPMVGRKGQVLAENPRVCFEIDRFTASLDDYSSALVEGELLPVEDLAEKARVKAANDAKYTRLRGGVRRGHGRSTPLGLLPLWKVVVSQVSGRRK